MFKKSLVLAAAIASIGGASADDAPLKLDVFNPGEAAIFPVASVLVTGRTDAVLIDAQFSRAEAQKLAERIRASGKRLTTIYISHGDPDFYFGLDVLQAAFPDAKIVATSHTIAAMRKKAEAKIAYWGPILKQNAPKHIVYPQLLEGDTITLEGQALKVTGATPERSYVWIPSLKAVVGGVVVFGDLHVWVADTQSVQSRQEWQVTLDGIDALKPEVVVPGHFKQGMALSPASVGYTRTYLRQFESAAVKAANSGELVTAMRGQYPDAGLAAALETSAKVIKGEIKW
jgi:glyoxylase-like metal-dependent hydrolase (beta-lactamase superfamily II)